MGVKIKSHFVLGEGRMGDTLFTKEAIKKIKLPESVPILDNWDKTRVIGKATNFRHAENAIVCDGEITDKEMADRIEKGTITSIAPGVKLGYIRTERGLVAKDLELDSLSTTNEPADERNKISKIIGLKQEFEKLNEDRIKERKHDDGLIWVEDVMERLNKSIAKLEKLIKVVGGDTWLEEALNLFDSNLGRPYSLDSKTGGRT